MAAREPFPVPEDAIEERFLAATGPGGQNVNKVATAVQIRLHVRALQLPSAVVERLRGLAGSRMTDQDEIVLTARSFRTREANRVDARDRLGLLLARAHERPERRVKTRPSRAAKEKRMEGKAVRSVVKRARGRPTLD